MERDELVTYLDAYLQTRAIEDSSDNGLQVEGVGEVDRLALAVDAGLAAFEAAKAAGAQMLIVHHGLFWSTPVMVTGLHRRRLALLLDAGISLYAVHLPLDFHEEVGNNVTLARWLELQGARPFGEYKGHPAGVMGRLPRACSLDSFATQVERVLGESVVQVWPFGQETVKRAAVSSGAAGSLVAQAAAAGVDVYLTGELSHIAYHQARELGVNVVFAGHYATETAGLKALAGHLADRFGLACEFLDLPTGA
jgi:dinuclear metal center YbgI/SA1388 family protein